MNQRKFLSVLLLSTLVLVFALQFAAAAGIPLSDYFNVNSWISGVGLSTTLAKILFTLLVFMIVYSIFDRIPVFSERKWIAWPFSIIVAYLSMAYVTPSQVYAILISYSAMGFVLSAAIPFIIMVVFTFSLATDIKSIGNSMQLLANRSIAWLMWLAFFIFIAFKALEAVGSDAVWYWISASLILLVLIGFAALWKMFSKMAKEAVVESARDVVGLSVARDKINAKGMKDIGTE